MIRTSGAFTPDIKTIESAVKRIDKSGSGISIYSGVENLKKVVSRTLDSLSEAMSEAAASAPKYDGKRTAPIQNVSFAYEITLSEAARTALMKDFHGDVYGRKPIEGGGFFTISEGEVDKTLIGATSSQAKEIKEILEKLGSFVIDPGDDLHKIKTLIWGDQVRIDREGVTEDGKFVICRVQLNNRKIDNCIGEVLFEIPPKGSMAEYILEGKLSDDIVQACRAKKHICFMSSHMDIVI